MNLMQRNIKIAYLVTVLGKNGFFLAPIFFFLTEYKGFEITVALLLIGIRSASASFFEIPTGVVADKISRKLSIQLGYLLKSLGFFGVILLPGQLLAFLAMIVVGLGDSLASGADKSLVYDSLKSIGKEKEYKNFNNTVRGMLFTQTAITSLLGGFLAEINLIIPGLLASSFYFLGFVAALFFTEPAETKIGSEIEKIGYLAHAFESFKDLFSRTSLRKGVTFLAVAMILAEMIGKVNKNFIPPIFENLEADVALVGIVISSTYLTKAFGAFIARKYSKDNREYEEILVGIAVYIFSMITLILVPNLFVGIITFSLAIMFMPLIQTNFDQLINERIESHKRSTILSIVSLSENLLELIFLGVVGGILETSDSVLTPLLIVISIMIFMMLSLMRFRFRDQKSVIESAD